MIEALDLPRIEQVSKYRLVENLISEKIKLGQLPPGTQLPSEIKLAKELGTHRLTVNKALSNLVKEDFLYRVHGRGTFVNDHVKALMAKRDREKCGTVGVLFVGSGNIRNNDYFFPSYHALCAYFGSKNYLIKTDVVASFGECGDLIAHNSFVEGYVIYTFEDVSEKNLAAFGDSDIPFVLFNRQFKNSDSQVPCVIADTLNASAAMTKSLLEDGFKKILYVGRSDSASSVARDRRSGFVKAVRERKAFESSDFIQVTGTGFKSGAEAFEEIKSRSLSCDAIICEGAKIAIGLKRAFEKDAGENEAHPKLASLDSWGEHLQEILEDCDTVVFPLNEMGKRAGRLLMQLIDGSAENVVVSIPGEIKKLNSINYRPRNMDAACV